MSTISEGPTRIGRLGEPRKKSYTLIETFYPHLTHTSTAFSLRVVPNFSFTLLRSTDNFNLIRLIIE